MNTHAQLSERAGPGHFERAFVVVVLLLSTGAFINLFLNADFYLTPGNGIPGMQVAWTIAYCVTTILLAYYCKGCTQILFREGWVIALVGLALLSTCWSDAPSVTFRRAVALALTCLFALYFAIRFTLREQLCLLVRVFTILIVSSLFFGVLHIGTPVQMVAGAWYGVFTQRNTLGTMMVLATLTFVIWEKENPRQGSMARLGIITSALLVYLSHSVTSLLACVLVFPLVAYVKVFRRSTKVRTLAIITVCASLLFCYFAATHFDALTESLGRDPTLTGRTELWAITTAMALQRPWVGYGYSAFWLGAQGPSFAVWKIVGWTAPSAHNGLLEIWIDLGLAGVVLFIVGFIVYFRRALQFLRRHSSYVSAWPVLFLLTLCFFNLTESYLMEGNNLPWILYVAVAISVSAQRSQLRERVPT